LDHRLRRERLVARVRELRLDALLVTRLPNVRYLTGFTGSNGQLLVGEDTTVFFTDGRYEEQARREVPGADRRIYSQDFAGALGKACIDSGVAALGFEAAGLTYKTFQGLSGIEGVRFEPVGEEVERFRWIKDREEIDLLDRAQEATDEAFERILPKLAEGIAERDVALELEWAMRQSGADGVSFDSIVAFGENAAEPHHRPSDRVLRLGDVVKLDFGAAYGGYHADMTRTVGFGAPPEELRVIHDLVRRAQQAGVDAIAAGTSAGEADEAARALIRAEGRGDRFSHSLGHGVGLEVHEGPNLRAGSQDVLPVGAVVTVEPGVYVPGLGGVRIEDMVEVTADGCRVIGRSTRDLVVL
jgi:Xaa-Pro aminopeptidase